jgi:hypothetical protein
VDRHTLAIVAVALVLGARFGSPHIVALWVPIPFIRAPDRKQDRESGTGIVGGSPPFSDAATTSCTELGLATSNPL